VREWEVGLANLAVGVKVIVGNQWKTVLNRFSNLPRDDYEKVLE